MPRLPRTRSDRAALLGLALVAVGAWLPWVRRSPEGPTFLGYVTGLNSGLETLGLLTLPLAVAGAVVLLARPDRARRFLGTTGVGAVAALAAGYLLFLFPPGYGAFRAGSGVYVTLVGAVVLLAASVRGYRRTLG